MDAVPARDEVTREDLQVATFAGGCFWCTEAVFSRLRGVHRVVSGYTGGTVPNPTYKQVCTGATGHAEAVQIYFDPRVISYRELLDVFWHSHDPTTLNRQGNDVGTQYRSAIFYHDEEQRRAAEESKAAAAAEWDDPIVTEIVPAGPFYEAEPYHQDYFENHPAQPYCQLIIAPKIRKLEKHYREKLRR